MYLEESTVQKMRDELRYKDEIMMEALRLRDAHRLAAQEYKTKLDQALLENERLKLHIDNHTKEMEQVRNENRDLESFNHMLQRMIKKMVRQ
jgi:hypothetical protein